MRIEAPGVVNVDLPSRGVGIHTQSVYIRPATERDRAFTLACYSGSANAELRILNINYQALTYGIITNPDANQPYVPLLRPNQHYLSGNDDGDFTNGIDTTNNMMTSAAGASNLAGSWSGNQPAVGSLLSSNNAAIVRVTAHTGNDQITYAVEQGTTEQIQLGYQYPEVFTVTPP